MNDDLNEFERVARARLHRELGRVPVPAGRSSRARPRSNRGWGARTVGATALVAVLVLGAMIVAGGLRVAPETAQVATPTAQTAGTAPAERLILLSTSPSSTIIRAVDPATRQVVWMRESQAAALGGPAWIDGALSPDGSRLFVATHDGLAAYDTATWETIWTKDPTSADRIIRHAPGRPSAMAVAADGQRLYIQKKTAPNEYPRRWLDVVDTGTGKTQGSIALPVDDGVGQVFALADQIYYVTSDDVFTVAPGNRSISLAQRTHVGLGVSAAAPARDGRSIYVFNGVTLLNFDRSGMRSPSPKDQPVEVIPTFPPILPFGVISDTNAIIDDDSMRVEIDPEDPFWWENNPLAISPDGKIAAVQKFDSVAGPPELKIYAVAGLQSIATIADPGTSKADWLRGDTLQFNPAGTAMYAIAGPLGQGGGDSALLSLRVADGSATRLIELPGETVAGLLMAGSPVAPALAGPAGEIPTDEPFPAWPAPPPPGLEWVGPAIELPPTK